MAEKRKKEDENKEKERVRNILTLGKAVALASTISFQIAVPILLGVFGGRYLDERFGTQPWFLIAGLFLGLAAGVTGMIRTVQSFFKDS
jgi:F0F1-type ATP synthase assembly protein I